MPKNEPTFIMPRHAMQVAGVIKAFKGQKLDTDIYFSLLGERVQELIDCCDDREDAVDYTFNVLERVGLAYNRPEDVSMAGKSLVWENVELQEHLYHVGVTTALPNVLDENDPLAEALYQESDLESWFNAATTGL
jgi:hypothetical protein